MSLPPCCAWFEDQGALALRDGLPSDLDPALRAAIEACPDCQAALRGASSLRARLEAWSEPAAPDDLVARSLAAIAFKAAAEPLDSGGADEARAEEAVGAAVEEGAPALQVLPTPERDAKPSRRRRTTVIELLVSEPLSEPPAAAPSRGRLLFRFGLQAAAAVLLFAASSLFMAIYYPAVSFALEERELTRCEQRLEKLRRAALRYRREHPEGEALDTFALRRELIRGGYADELDFECPSQRGRELGQRSYVGALPAGVASLTSSQPLFWDRFGNHSTGFNVIRLDGQSEHVDEEAFNHWWRQRHQR